MLQTSIRRAFILLHAIAALVWQVSVMLSVDSDPTTTDADLDAANG